MKDPEPRKQVITDWLRATGYEHLKAGLVGYIRQQQEPSRAMQQRKREMAAIAKKVEALVAELGDAIALGRHGRAGNTWREGSPRRYEHDAAHPHLFQRPDESGLFLLRLRAREARGRNIFRAASRPGSSKKTRVNP